MKNGQLFHINTKEDAIHFLKNRKSPSDYAVFFDIDFSKTHFNFPADFSNCIFYGTINFSKTEFDYDTIFDSAIFKNFAVFDYAIFNSTASFKNCSFEYGVRFVFSCFQNISFYRSVFQVFAIFWNASFNKEADFSQCIVDLPEGLPKASDRQTNFSWAVFNGNVIFTLAKFYTPVYFWRTIFKENALLDCCIFNKDVIFEANPTYVHFTKAKDISIDTLNDLKKNQFLIPDMERQFGEIYQFNKIYSTEQLKSELDLIGSVKKEGKSTIIREWEKGYFDMFQEDKIVSFSGTVFEDLKNCSFNHINLNNVNCDKSISGTDGDKEYFVSLLNHKSHDFFISYAHEHREFVRELSKKLSKCGKITWFDENDISIGDALYSTIKKGLENSLYFIMILSPQYFIKEWTNKEFDLIKKHIDKIIPVWFNISENDVRNFNGELADRVAFNIQDYNNNLDKLSLDVIKLINKGKI